jgi:hypothetical protein
MSRHGISTARFSSAFQSDEIRVPVNLVGFRYDHSRFSIAAVMGVTMTVGFCGFPAMLVYIWIMEPAERSPGGMITSAVLSLVLLLTISAATWPALQSAKLLSKTLKKRLPAIIVNSDGIQDYVSNSVFGLIPWSEIVLVFATSRYSNRQSKDYPGIVVVVKDRHLLRRRLGLAGFRLEDYPRSADRRQIFIPQDRIAMPVKEVVEQINAFRARITK